MVPAGALVHNQKECVPSYLHPGPLCVCILWPCASFSQSALAAGWYSCGNPPSCNSHFIHANKTVIGLIISSTLSSRKCIWMKGHLLNYLVSHKIPERLPGFSSVDLKCKIRRSFIARLPLLNNHVLIVLQVCETICQTFKE